MRSIYPFFKWANDTWIARTISDSSWLFPAIEGVHIVALALLFGAVLVLNLRLLGVLMRQRPLPQLFRELEPWTVCSLVIILVSGAMLFASEAVKTFYSTPFKVKMVLLAVAIVFHFTASSSLMHKEERQLSPVLRKAAAVIAIALWMGVGFAGRAIGFL